MLMILLKPFKLKQRKKADFIRLFFILLMANLFNASTTFAVSFIIESEVDSYSEPVPVYQISHDWKKGFQEGSFAYAHGSFKTGIAISKTRFHFGYIQRYDYVIDLNPDTAELIYFSEQDISIPDGSEYEIDFTGHHNKSNGVYLGTEFSWRGKTHLYVESQFLFSNQIEDARLVGQGSADEDGGIQAMANIEYRYNEDKLFELNNKGEPKAKGIALAMKGEHSEGKHHFRLDIKDLYYRMDWDRAAGTLGRLDSNVVVTDESGFTHVYPVFQGRFINEAYRQRLRPRMLLNHSVELENFTVGWGYRYAHRYRSYLFKIGMDVFGLNHEFAYEIKAKAYSYRISRESFYLNMILDSHFEASYRVNLSFGFQINYSCNVVAFQ